MALKSWLFYENLEQCAQFEKRTPVNLQVDLHARNLFWVDGRGFLIIDWEDTGYGHPYFDVATLAIFLGFEGTDEQTFLTGYLDHPPTNEEMREYSAWKKVAWAYIAVVNQMWAYRALAKDPHTELVIAEPDRTFAGYMQFFSETQGLPPLEFFMNVSRLALLNAE